MPEGRRRLAAIMFTDMVGFSGLAQRDESLALRLVDEQRKLLGPVVERFGGRVVKTMGDGALVVFDSALDAAECAVQLQRQLFERNQTAPGEPIEMRVGIHVGDVVQSDTDVHGDAVNIASRIEPLAETGGVCVSGPVHEQVQNKLPYPLRPVEKAFLKNIDTPVSVYRVELPWTPPSLADATPFTDRKENLQRLKGAFARASAGEGFAVAITGEAGVGKSRLTEEFAARAAHEGARLLRGRAERGGLSAPFGPWSDAVRAFARAAANPVLYEACQDCGPEIAQLAPELQARLGRRAELPAGVEASQSRLFEGILRFLGNLSAEEPVVLVLDDLQWADSASLRLFDYVARRARGLRVLLLAAYRDEQTPELGTLEGILSGLTREHCLELMRLNRFDAAASLQMLQQMLRGRLPPSGGDLASPLFEKSGGNPMILEAIVRSLVAEGSLAWSEEGWSPKPGIDIRLPPGVQSVVRRRLAELPGPTVDVLRQASVLGSQFSFDALQRVTEIPAAELLVRLEEAIRARLLEERPGSSGRSTYAFTERPVLETLYDEISLVRRARYHATAGRILEGLSAEGTPVPAAELAQHFLRANDYDKALRFTVLAAEEAERLYAREEALRYYATAQELLESRPDERRRADVLFAVGKQLDSLGRHTEAYRAMRESAELYERLGLTTQAGAVHANVARRISAHNEPVRALEHLEKARQLLEKGPPSIELARLYDSMGVLMLQEVRVQEAADHWLRAIGVASKVGAAGVEASARMALATIVPPGENDKVWEYIDTALDLAQKANARAVVPNAFVVKAVALLQIRGDGRGALRAAEDAIEYARQGRDELSEKATRGWYVPYFEWRLGDFPRAAQVAEEYRAYVAGDPRRDRPTTIAVLAEVALARGDVDRAEKLLWEGERLLAEGGDWSEGSQTQIALARCALARHRALVAVEHLRVSEDLCRKAGPPAINALFLLETLSLLVRAHLDDGQLDAAERSLRELTEFAQLFAEPLGHAFRLRAEGWVRTQRGELPAASAALEESGDLWKRLGWQYEWAQTVLALAEVHRGSGETKKAAVLVDRATEFLSKVGARSGVAGAGGGREPTAV